MLLSLLRLILALPPFFFSADAAEHESRTLEPAASPPFQAPLMPSPDAASSQASRAATAIAATSYAGRAAPTGHAAQASASHITLYAAMREAARARPGATPPPISMPLPVCSSLGFHGASHARHIPAAQVSIFREKASFSLCHAYAVRGADAAPPRDARRYDSFSPPS